MKETIISVKVNQELYNKVAFVGGNNISKGLRIMIDAYDEQAAKKLRIEELQKELDALQRAS